MDVSGSSVSKEEPVRESSNTVTDIQSLSTTLKETTEATVVTRLDTLASELLLEIFGFLGKGMAVCLGLTCRRLYNLLKSQYPHPINLSIQLPSRAQECYNCLNRRSCQMDNHCWTDLYHILATWVGPRYRLGYTPFPQLLYYDRNIYGDISYVPGIREEDDSDLPVGTALERRVKNRYDDYYRVAGLAFTSSSRSEQAPHMPLPNPFNRGEDWYAEAVDAIKNDVSNFQSWEDWRYFWSSIFVFREFRETFDKFEDENRWEIGLEGLALMGL